MTLRVTLEIVPYGEEINKYTIGYLNISNTLDQIDGLYKYHAALFSDGETELKVAEVGHNRSDGAWVLVKKAIERLGI